MHSDWMGGLMGVKPDLSSILKCNVLLFFSFQSEEDSWKEIIDQLIYPTAKQVCYF
jgi:hypothetical protein